MARNIIGLVIGNPMLTPIWNGGPPTSPDTP
jgi:hypothetical protein